MTPGRTNHTQFASSPPSTSNEKLRVVFEGIILDIWGEYTYHQTPTTFEIKAIWVREKMILPLISPGIILALSERCCQILDEKRTDAETSGPPEEESSSPTIYGMKK
jgi:hypothetical protein